MRLVIFSHFFAPSIGSVEKQVHSLARGLARRKPSGGASNFEVTVITNTPGRDTDDQGDTFEVVRCPTFFQLWRLIQRAEVVHLAGPSLLPLLISRLLRKPTVIEHHGYQSICPKGLLIHQPERSLCPGHFQAKRYAKCFRCLASEMSVTRSLKNILLMFPRYLLSKSVTANIAITEHVLQRHRALRDAWAVKGSCSSSFNYRAKVWNLIYVMCAHAAVRLEANPSPARQGVD